MGRSWGLKESDVSRGIQNLLKNMVIKRGGSRCKVSRHDIKTSQKSSRRKQRRPEGGKNKKKTSGLQKGEMDRAAVGCNKKISPQYGAKRLLGGPGKPRVGIFAAKGISQRGGQK